MSDKSTRVWGTTATGQECTVQSPRSKLQLLDPQIMDRPNNTNRHPENQIPRNLD